MRSVLRARVLDLKRRSDRWAQRNATTQDTERNIDTLGCRNTTSFSHPLLSYHQVASLYAFVLTYLWLLVATMSHRGRRLAEGIARTERHRSTVIVIQSIAMRDYSVPTQQGMVKVDRHTQS